MGGCFGCCRKKEDLNEVNQDDILWLKINSSLTTGIPSNLHFSIGGLSDASGQEPAVVTARKAQEKAEREKAKLEALKNKATTSVAGNSDKAKTTTPKAGKNGGGDEPLRISLEKLMQDDTKEDKPLTIKDVIQEAIKGEAESQKPIKGKAKSQEPIKNKAESQEPIKGKADESQEPIRNKVESQEPYKDNASKSQLSNSKDDATADVETAKKDLLTNSVNVQHEVEAEKAKLQADGQDKVESEASKAKSEDVGKVDTDVLEIGNDGKVPSVQPEGEADAIIEDDVINEIKADVINKVHSDVNNNVQLDVITKHVIAAQPSQVSLTFEYAAEESLTEDEDEAETGDENEATITEAVKLPDQSVTMETADTENEVEIPANQDGSTASEEPHVASKSQNGQIVTSESELQSKSEVENEQQKDGEASDEDDLACVDELFSQPLVPQLSEVVRVGVIARVPEDDTTVATESSNNDVVEEDGEKSDIVENADK